MNRRSAAVVEGELEARRLTLSFLWYKRTFALFPDFSFCRYDGAELRHSATITHSTTVSKLGSREFVLTFAQPELRYHIRAATCDERDRWVAALQNFINRASAAALSQAAAVPSSGPRPPPSSSPASPSPAVNFATEWLDESGCVCPKTVDYASQCPKGHALVAFTDDGGGASAPRLLCRVCHTFTERDRASQWLVCCASGCCEGYAVCGGCVSALQQPPAAAAGGDDFPSLVSSMKRCRPSRD